MKVALLGDTHFGARSDNLSLHTHFKKFYSEVFFPYLIANDIKTVVQFGDLFDRRKFINVHTLWLCKDYFFDKLREYGITFYALVGNHDSYFKNSIDVTSVKLFLREYEGENFQLISEPTEIQLDNLKVLALPWICDGNSIETYELIRDTDASVCFGHLELDGFQMYKGSVQHEGMDPLMFDKFDMVMSGHYHHRSTNGNITYLGTPYEMIWSDYGDTKGFHILDTANRDLTFVPSPYKLFHKVYYDDRDTTVEQLLDFDASLYTDCYVKIIIKAKTNPYWYDLFLEKLEEAVPIDVQPVEDNLNLNQESDEDILDEAEDTVTILRKCVDSLETNEDKPALQLLLRNLYEEALSYSVSI